MTLKGPDSPVPDARDEIAEEQQLWARYYEATARALKLVRAGGVASGSLAEILAEDARSAEAINRIKQIRGIKD
jgi:hypothetical protein